MKVLLINKIDIEGGAAKAVYRLHKALLESGIDSKMLVQIKKTDDYTILGPNTKLQKAIGMISSILDRVPVKLYKNRTKTLFSPSWLPFSNVVDMVKDIKPDIVHLHWICDGMIRIEELAKIEFPIIWSLHDMWAFTGGCHYDEGCGGYRKNCGNCKVLGSEKEDDLSRKTWKRKHKIFSKLLNVAVVGLSKWITSCAQKSTLLEDKKVINIPNLIDTRTFKPFGKEKSRVLLNLPHDKKLVLFGAMEATSDPRKGFKELSEALHKLKNKDIELVVFGSSKPQDAPEFGFKTHYLGQLYDDISLVILYNAVDVVVVPSLQENLSNVIMESLSCATPVVAFDVGGNRDMIEHCKNGYLAKPFDTTELAYGIEWVLNNKDYEELCKNAREKIVKEFDSRVVVQRYIRLYEEVLRKRSN